jgi:hypothetical protein
MPKIPRPHACCNIDKNLIKYSERPELEIEECKVCGCMHRRLLVRKAILNTKVENAELRRSSNG